MVDFVDCYGLSSTLVILEPWIVILKLYFPFRTSNELLSLEKAVSAWAEWESALRELQGALRGDLATLESLRDRGALGDQTEVAAQIKQLAASLVEKNKVGNFGLLLLPIVLYYIKI